MILKNNFIIDAEALDSIRQRNDGLFSILYEITLKLFDVDFQKMHENQQAVLVNTMKRYNLLIVEDQSNKVIKTESPKDFFQIDDKNLPEINTSAQNVYNEVFASESEPQYFDYDGEQ